MKREWLRQLPSGRRLSLAVAIGAFLGIVWFVLLRAITLDVGTTHHHANFALYINGQREMFSEGTFYEEVSTCGSIENDPLARVHLHDQVPDVAHVHDASATWGNLFENLGFVLGDNILYARGQAYTDDGGQLMFMLNGERARSVAGKTINSEDVLLISYDTDPSVLQAQYDAIERTATEYNERADPSACTGSQTPNLWDRILIVLGLEDSHY